MRRARRRSDVARATALAVLFALMATSCGSTVQQTTGADVGRAGPEADDGLSLGTATGDMDDTLASLGQVNGDSEAAPRRGGVAAGHEDHARAGVTAPHDRRVPPARAAAVPSAQGVDDKTVRVGVLISSDTEGSAAAAGLSGITVGNNRSQVEALIDYLNANGGVVGRKLVADFQSYESTEPTEEEYRRFCTHYSQDVRVIAVLAYASPDEALMRCLADANTIYLSAYGAVDTAVYRDVARYWYNPADFIDNRWARVYARALVEEGFFGATATVGLLRRDTPLDARVADDLKAELARHGVSVAEEVAFSSGNESATQFSGAALRFRSRGVTHVANMIAGSIVFFMQSAESQGYRPRYGLSSRDGPGAWVQVLAPPGQLTGSLGIGWIPLHDVDRANDPGPVSQNQSLCFELMRKAGEDMSNRLVQVVAARYCDAFFLFAAGFQGASAVTTEGFEQRVGQFGDSFPSALTFGTRFGPRRHDGPRIIRSLTYSAGCACFRYTGKPRPVRTS